MNKTIRHMLAGAAAALTIFPEKTDFPRIPKGEERMRGHFVRVSDSFRSAIGRYENEVSHQKEKA
ncbi:MAG: hypothetical protein H7831_09015 [Magnetococcus sp. WYHC-3]